MVTDRVFVDRDAPKALIQGVEDYTITSKPVQVSYLAEEENVIQTVRANILKEDIDGNFIISVEGTEFVKEDGINEIALLQDENTGFYTPYWKHFAKTDAAGKLDISRAKVFNLDMEISTDMNTDIGGLKATLIARGDHRATYKDLENKDVYDKSIAPSVVMNIQAEFDQLINKVSTRINEMMHRKRFPVHNICGIRIPILRTAMC